MTIYDTFDNTIRVVGQGHELLLYYLDSCTYCQKVRDFIDAKNISIPTKNVETDPKALEDLLKKTNRYTVPCLFINGKAMYESDNIIHWLKTNMVI